MIKELSLHTNNTKPGVVFGKKRRGEIRRNYSDIKKARRLLGFRPRINLEQGITDLINLSIWS